MQLSPKLYNNTVKLLAGCLADLFKPPLQGDSALIKISCYQDYIKIYLCPRVTCDIRDRLWNDEVLAYTLNIGPQYPQKYHTSQQAMFDFLTQKRNKWWLSLDKQWMQDIGKQIPTSRHLERQAWQIYAPLLLPQDVVDYINDFI